MTESSWSLLSVRLRLHREQVVVTTSVILIFYFNQLVVRGWDSKYDLTRFDNQNSSWFMKGSTCMPLS